MDAKPEWVTEWLWTGFDEYLRSSFVGAPDGLNAMVKLTDPSERDIGLIESVLRDERCAPVWNAMDKRKGEPTRRRGHRLEGLPSRVHEVWRREAVDFFHSLTACAFGVGRGSAVRSSERRMMGKRINTHALALRHELNALESACRGDALPEPFVARLRSLFDDVANDYADRVLTSDFVVRYPDHVPAGLKERDGAAWYSYMNGVVAGIENIQRTLAAIAAAADEWAQTKPPIGHPGDANAARLYFIRGITAYFREAYGTPLREPTAVLARILYDCDMDAATVDKLAP